jgi:AraC-like DNA-binding protein
MCELHIYFLEICNISRLQICNFEYSQTRSTMRSSNHTIPEEIKIVINEFVRNRPALNKIRFSVYLSEKVPYDYTYLANVFSRTQGKSIEQYLIARKIDRVKELLRDDELTLSEIAIAQHYSSLPHLSAQFKKVTGTRISDFRKMFVKNYNVALADKSGQLKVKASEFIHYIKKNSVYDACVV